MSKLLLGPLLGLESDNDYTVCFLTENSVTAVSVIVNGDAVPASKIEGVSSGQYWRAEIDVQASGEGRWVDYHILIDGDQTTDRSEPQSWRFYVPAEGETPRIAYASCNGFSSADLVTKTEFPYVLWSKLKKDHNIEPFGLLIMGGDQLYADEIWGKVSELRKWGDLSRSARTKRKASGVMREQITRFYENLYQERWKDPSMAEMLASIPNVMMWDDHDIFDGWGSFPDDLNNCDVCKAIFGSAKHYFELFQMRTRLNKSLLDPSGDHYAFHLKFRGQHILGTDNRAEHTREQVMSKQQWNAVNGELETKIADGDLFVLSAVPVVYRDFSFTEAVFDATPWEEDLTDDLKDHWRSKQHEGERARLIMRLLKNQEEKWPDKRTVILSGDVHIGCVGVINDPRGETPCRIHQVVSSGIVHPSPSRLQWLGIMAATNDDTEYLNEDKTIDIGMLKPFGSDKYIRARNYVSLEEGDDQKLWVNWTCDNGERPSYPLA